MTRNDFVFTIGFDGPAAVIDGQAMKKYKSLSTKELAEKGLFRAAYSSALYSKDPKEMEALIAVYNKLAGTNLTVNSPLDRLFGVFLIDDVKRTIVL